MTRQDFHIVQAFRAAHHVDLEAFLRHLVELVRDVRGGGLVRLEMHVIHMFLYPSIG